VTALRRFCPDDQQASCWLQKFGDISLGSFGLASKTDKENDVLERVETRHDDAVRFF